MLECLSSPVVFLSSSSVQAEPIELQGIMGILDLS